MITYKGYIGTVEYSHEDKVFWGKIHGINDIVTFEADTAIDLEPSFHESVDDYLETCKKIGKEPEKVFKGSFNVRMKPENHKKLYETSLKEGLSLNAVLEKTVEFVLSNREDLEKNGKKIYG